MAANAIVGIRRIRELVFLSSAGRRLAEIDNHGQALETAVA
jgi:hypothetical protein